MRFILVGASLGLLSLGCGSFNMKPNGGGSAPPVGWDHKPKAEQLVAYLNQNGQSLQSIEAKKVFLTAKQNNEHVGGLEGFLACQKAARVGTAPNFRLTAQALGSDEVDIGSNSDEFWFWIKRSPQPYVFHCAYVDYPAVAKRGAMPFPFQPEWVVETLGMATYDPAAKYEVSESSKTYDLVQRTQSAKGDEVTKVIAFHKNPRAGASQVAGYFLYQPTGNTKKPYDLLCSAVVDDSQVVAVGGGKSAVLPSKVRLSCPKESMELTVELGKVQVNVPFDRERSSVLFTRRTLGNYKSYDLARGPDAPASGIRPAGGIER